MSNITLNQAVHKCEQLQEQIKQGEEYNLDEDVLIGLRKQYDFYFKLVVKLERGVDK